MALLSALLAALLALPSLMLEPVSGGHPLCSMVVVPGGRSVTATVLLATASADTVSAGSGQVVPSEHGGHSGTGSPGPIYGQVFDVARFGGADSMLLARAFQGRSDMRALIVPWDYDPSCALTRWTSGFAWVPVGEPGTFTLQLRPDSLWVGGLPVFDAFVAAFEPYPLSPVYRDSRQIPPSLRTIPMLSAEQYFELLLAMPTHEDRVERPDSAWMMFLRWQAANPELAERYPAAQIPGSLASDVVRIKARRALRSIEPVIAGTYRMSLSLDGGYATTFYVRTRPRPSNEWRPNRASEPVDPLDEPRRPEAYSIIASGAPSLEALATDCAETREISREGYMYVIDPSRSSNEIRTEWQGWVEVELLARQLPEDSALAQFRRQAFDEWAVRWNTIRELEAPARFWLGSDGVLRLEQTTRLQDGRTLLLVGERVSEDVIACEW